MLVIVNADDLGTSEQINCKIFELMNKGLVTSSTLIANAPAFDHAVNIIKDFPQCSFGIHLNLTVFRPLTQSDILNEIICADGAMSDRFFRAPFSKHLLDAIQNELFAQVNRVLDSGIRVSHIDSHQHIHTKPQLFGVIRSIQRKFNINRMRSTINILPNGKKLPLILNLKKQLYYTIFSKVCSVNMPEKLCNFCVFAENMVGNSNAKFKSLELMVHPGTTDEYYSNEIKLLESSNLGKLFGGDLKFGNYYNL